MLNFHFFVLNCLKHCNLWLVLVCLVIDLLVISLLLKLVIMLLVIVLLLIILLLQKKALTLPREYI